MKSFNRTIVLSLVFLWPFFSISKYAISSEESYKLVRRDKPFAVHFLDEKKGWIVGDRGLVLKTTDGAESWQRIDMITGGSFKDITFINKDGWIVGEEGLILHTTDGGNNWRKQEANTEIFLMKVFFLDKSKGFVVGSEGTILRTENGGASWRQVPLDWIGLLPETLLERGTTTLNLYDIFFIDKVRGWAVGDFGTVIYTSDGGDNWEVLQIGLFPHFFTVYFRNGLEGLAAGQNGLFLRTEDGGRHWKNVSMLTKESLYRIHISGDYGVIVGDHGSVFQSNNSGETWTKVNLNMNPPLPWFVDAFIIPSKSNGKVVFIGKGIIKNITIPSASLQKN
ncbi:MAG: YCF48-related protein [Thermodesulfobacteriota bacterium]|nr:YCF48-related protein [Thermodesulfobacteriota bacterium]